MIHVGGTYTGANGSLRRTGSEGCFTLAGKSEGNQGNKRFSDDIKRRAEVNKRANKGTNITLQIQRRNNVRWRFQINEAGERVN